MVGINLLQSKPSYSDVEVTTVIRVRTHVREVAEARNITRAKLSRLADVSPGTLDKIWRNPYHEAYLSTLARIALALGVAVETLYTIEHDDSIPFDDS